MKKTIRLLTLATSALAVFTLTACGATPVAPTTTTVDNAGDKTTTVDNAGDKTTTDDTTTTTDDDTQEERVITRKLAQRTYTHVLDGKGYYKIDDFEDEDLYISISQPYDYAVFYGYSIEGYYKFYPNYFQEYDEDGNVTTDYFELLKTAIDGKTFAPVTEEIKGYLEKISSLYYGSYENAADYWRYFCYLPEDSQPYQQLYDVKGKAKIEGYVQSDLYVATKSVLSCAFYGYTMDQYHTWYEDSKHYFSKDGVDYYDQLKALVKGEPYVQVTDEIKTCLENISNAFWNSPDYWEYFCFVKTEIIPEGKFETITTNYYEILVEECGHNTYVKVNDKIKEALQYLASAYYYDEDSWDCFTFVTPEVAGEDPTIYSELTAAPAEDDKVFVSIEAANSYLYNYSISSYYGYGGSYAACFQSGDNDYYLELKALIEAAGSESIYVEATPEMIEVVKNISGTYYGDPNYYYCFLYKEDTTEYVPLLDESGEYKTIHYTDDDLYVNLDEAVVWIYVGGSGYYSLSTYYGYGGQYAGYFIKTEVVEVIE